MGGACGPTHLRPSRLGVLSRAPESDRPELDEMAPQLLANQDGRDVRLQDSGEVLDLPERDYGEVSRFCMLLWREERCSVGGFLVVVCFLRAFCSVVHPTLSATPDAHCQFFVRIFFR